MEFIQVWDRVKARGSHRVTVRAILGGRGTVRVMVWVLTEAYRTDSVPERYRMTSVEALPAAMQISIVVTVRVPVRVRINVRRERQAAVDAVPSMTIWHMIIGNGRAPVTASIGIIAYGQWCEAGPQEGVKVLLEPRSAIVRCRC